MTVCGAQAGRGDGLDPQRGGCHVRGGGGRGSFRDLIGFQ